MGELILEIKGGIRCGRESVGEMWKRYGEEDGFLYVYVRGENAF